MGSLFFLLSLLLMTVVMVDAFTATITNSKPGLCIGVQSNANIAANPTYPVLYGCNVGYTSNTGAELAARLTFSTTHSFTGNECLPTTVSVSEGVAATYTKITPGASTYNFAINSGSVTAGSVHLLKVTSGSGACNGLDADYYFYIQFLGAPSITSITGTTTLYNQYCSITNSGDAYTISSCHKSGKPSITVNGVNFDGNVVVDGSLDEDFSEYACEIAAVKGPIVKPTWNTATGTINTASSVVVDIAEYVHGTTSTSGLLVAYVPGKNCYLSTKAGATTQTFSIDWFTATTTFTQLTSSVCTSSGNNITDCPPLGSNGAQAITFIGTNFGPNDAPLTLVPESNTICTTNTLTRVPGFDQATCILKASAGGALTAPSLLAIGVTSSSGISGPTFSYGSAVITNITCSNCACYGACDYNGNGVTDSLCGCATSDSGLSIGTITLGGRNFLASGPYDACNGNYQSTDGVTATCTAVSGSANTTRPAAVTAGLIAFKTNHFNAVPLIPTVTYKSSSGGTNYFDLTVTLKAQKAGRAYVRLVASSYIATEAAVKDGTGGGFKCFAGPVSVGANILASIPLSDCAAATGDKVVAYIDQAVGGTTESGYFGALAESSETVTLPPVVTSITVSGSGSCTQCSVASGKGTTNICGCTGGETITIHGENLNGQTENSVCSVNTVSSSPTSFSCTLKSSSVGDNLKVGFTTTGYGGDVRAYFFSNSASAVLQQNAPSSVSVLDYKTYFTVSFTASRAGKAYAVAFASSGNDFVANATQVKSVTHIPSGVHVCNAAQSGNAVSAGGSYSYTFTCGDGTSSGAFAMTNGWTARIFVYAEGESEAATDYYGSVSSTVITYDICNTDCATCSRSEIGYCLSCKSSPAGVHLETYNSKKYCCLAECATCGPRSNAGTTLSADSCITCNTTKKDRLSADGQLPTYCCHGSCSTCNGNSMNQCLTCGGYHTNQFYNGMCKNGTYEIHGDPHFHGYLDQDYTVTGRPSAVYSIITDPWLQYNTRFIWYGDVYHGFDPTTNKPYDANVTYIGEIGMKFNWGNYEDRVYINVDGFAVFLNGRQITDTATATKFGDGCSIVRSVAAGKKFIDVETKKFRVRFFLAGSRKHPFINQRVELLNWMGIASHGLLGQTWKHEQVKGINRNAIWEGHQGGVDFQFRTAEFLEGHLWDYEIKENNVFGDDFTYNQYTFKIGK